MGGDTCTFVKLFIPESLHKPNSQNFLTTKYNPYDINAPVNDFVESPNLKKNKLVSIIVLTMAVLTHYRTLWDVKKQTAFSMKKKEK